MERAPPVLMDCIGSHVFVQMEGWATDVMVSCLWLSCHFKTSPHLCLIFILQYEWSSFSKYNVTVSAVENNIFHNDLFTYNGHKMLMLHEKKNISVYCNFCSSAAKSKSIGSDRPWSLIQQNSNLFFYFQRWTTVFLTIHVQKMGSV